MKDTRKHLRVNVHSQIGSGADGAGKRAFFSPHERVNVHSLQEAAKPTSPRGSLNAAIGWTGIALGLAAALWIGMWAFSGPMPAPEGFESYDALPRRLLRLAHIAAVAVGALNVLLGRELPRLALAPKWKSACSWLAIAAWPGLTLVLAAAAFKPEAKYALPAGALALTSSMTIAAAGAWRRWAGRPAAERRLS
ncbi:MAG: hypothetical protein FD180_312 [Planctomycetota bacterium]|nr:MAG: hypothetical protein FD180_312 [Planctomycetota bacterium]